MSTNYWGSPYWPPKPIIGPNGPRPPTPPIIDPLVLWVRLVDGERFSSVAEEDRPALDQEIKQEITSLLETKTVDAPQFHLALADFYASRGLIFRQVESLGSALLLDRDTPSRSTCEMIAAALELTGGYDYAAGWYQYLAKTAPDVATCIECVENQALCLQQYVSTLR